MNKILCNNFNSKNEAHWDVLINKNLKVIKALIHSNLCNIYHDKNNSLIIECKAIMEDMKQIQQIIRSTLNNNNYKVVYADPMNYKSNFTLFQ